ncbi:hypothetical protein ACSBR2_008355 [Camellia fascicularis]
MATHLPILLVLAFACYFSSIYAETVRKELRTKEANQAKTIRLGHSIQSNRIDPSRVIQLSWRPRVFLYRGFLSEEECDRLIFWTKSKENSIQNGGDSGKVGTSKLPRSSEISSSMNDDIEATIEERISAWTFLPKGSSHILLISFLITLFVHDVPLYSGTLCWLFFFSENSKPLQVLHFGLEDTKEKYDYFGNKSMLALNETLMATVILYLSNVSHGGQILFPESELENSKLKNRIWSDCTKSSNVMKPTKGNAILFFNSHPNASPDSRSNHARCPVFEGEMWCATKFFCVRAITRERVPFQLEGSDCTDEDENCPRWAVNGECQRNPVFMIGSPDYYGTCRKSCNAC